MKKLICIILSIMLLCGVCPAFALETDTVLYLTDLEYTSASRTDWGEICNNTSVAGNPISLRNEDGSVQIYENGIGVNATAHVYYDLSDYTSRGYNYFECTIGVDHDVAGQYGGTVAFYFLLDGTVVYESGTMTESMPAKLVRLDITDVSMLELYAESVDGTTCDHADFAGARIERNNMVLQSMANANFAVDSVALLVGDVQTTTVSATLVNGAVATPNATYTSSDPSVLQVSADGRVTAKSAGSAVVTATITYHGTSIDRSLSFAVLRPEDIQTVSSPDGSITGKFFLVDGTLHYTVAKNGKDVVLLSDLGITTSIADFTSDLTLTDISTNSITQSYPMIGAKATTYTDDSNEMTLTLEKEGQILRLVVRAANDALSYRYEIEEDAAFSISGESSTYQLPGGSAVYGEAYNNHYETSYTASTSENIFGNYCMALTYTTPSGTHVLLNEANMGVDYCGTMLTAKNGILSLNFTPDQKSDVVTTSGTFRSPWRVAVIGDLAAITETQVFENLSEPCAVEDTSWIQPGITTWTWLTGYITDNPELYKQYIDLSAEMGWQYVLLDEGWSTTGRSEIGFPVWFDEVVSYGKEKNVGILVWMHKSAVDTPDEQETYFAQLEERGVAGVKIDFFDDESQATMQLYDALEKATMKYHLAVNFHGADKTTGEARTYPHVLAREGVLGNESTVSAIQNNLHAYTRAAVGNTDFTPKLLWGSVTTNHMAALTIIYQCGLATFADSPDNYRNSNLYNWFQNFPAQFDETRFLDGSIGQYTQIARRSGSTWYASAITVSARDAVFDLSFLETGKNYVATVYADTGNSTESSYSAQIVTSADVLTIPMEANGGANVKLQEIDSLSGTLLPSAEELTVFVGKKGSVSVETTGNLREYPVLWSSSDEAVASVSGSGTAIVSGNAVGTATLTAVVGIGENAVSATVLVHVVDLPFLVEEGWSIRGEDAEHYFVNAEDSLTLEAGMADLYDYPNKVMSNLFLRDAGKNDLTLTVKLEFAPDTDYQSAGLIVYLDDENYYSFQRRYHSGYGGSCVCAVSHIDGAASENAVSWWDDITYLKIVKSGDSLTAWYSADGEEWQTDAVFNRTIAALDTDSVKIGVYAGRGVNQPAAGYLAATFTGLTLDKETVPFGVENIQPSVLLGDMNGDGVLSVTDVVLLRKAILNDTFSNVGDMNQDASLSVTDVVLLRKAILS